MGQAAGPVASFLGRSRATFSWRETEFGLAGAVSCAIQRRLAHLTRVGSSWKAMVLHGTTSYRRLLSLDQLAGAMS